MFTTVDATELTKLVARAVPTGTPRTCKNRRFIAVVPSPAGLTSPVKLPAACKAIIIANVAAAPDTIENTRGDPSLITDFNGFIGSAEWGGGTGTDQTGTTLYWAADLRFMDGEYIALDGHHRHGAFVFV